MIRLHVAKQSPEVRRRPRRWWSAAAWAGSGIVLYALVLRISFGGRIDSDGANNALQAWDLIHGHLLLHGWLLGDATFFFFELPLIGVVQLMFGLGTLSTHVASALVFLIVAGCVVALAVTGSSGPAKAAHSAVAVAVLAGPLLTMPTVWLLVEEPDHIGTSVFLLASILLIDRVPGRRFTAPLLCVILCAGQLSDLTVRYVAVPAVVLACGYRVLAARKLRSPDAAAVVAAAVSVPLAWLLSALMKRAGGFLMDQPRTEVAPFRQWPSHVSAVWGAVRYLFGTVDRPDTLLGSLGAAFGVACLAAAVIGFVRVAWTWRRASAAEQLLAIAIVVNLGAYLVSAKPEASGSHEIAAVLPCGAVLAARALIPARITGELRAVVVAMATALIALLPLGAAATRPSVGPALGPAQQGNGATAPTAPLTSFLQAHGLRYGIAGYWEASIVSLQSSGKAEVRAVVVAKKPHTTEWDITAPWWETNSLWYDPTRYNATFAVADVHGIYPAAAFEQVFGRPAAIYRVQNWLILQYRTNLLRHLPPRPPIGTGAK
jgi:hypothetical protein